MTSKILTLPTKDLEIYINKLRNKLLRAENELRQRKDNNIVNIINKIPIQSQYAHEEKIKNIENRWGKLHNPIHYQRKYWIHHEEINNCRESYQVISNEPSIWRCRG